MESAAKSPAEFDAQLRALTPRLLALPLATALCVLVWLASVLGGGMNWLQPQASQLFSWGANSALAVDSGQWWRLFTSMFLHAGIVHLAVNMLALWQAGVWVTRLHGNRGFTLIYLGAGLVGSAWSLHFAAKSGVSVGASGAVFGVMGALLASVLQHRQDIPIARSKPLLLGVGFFVIYSFWVGLSSKGTDNAAHAAGLLTGLTCGWIMIEKINVAATHAQRQMRLGASVLLCVVALLAGVLSMGQKVTPLVQVDAATNAAQQSGAWPDVRVQLARVVNAAQQDAQLHQAGKLQTSSFVDHLKNKHVPALRGLEKQLTDLIASSDQTQVPSIAAHLQFATALRNLFEAQIAQASLPPGQGAEEMKRLADNVSQARKLLGAEGAQK